MVGFIKPFNNDPSVGHLSTPVTSSKPTKVYLGNLPLYREGLSPVFRGLEIGITHGYFLIGPFYKLGPLRNSEISLLGGFLSSLGLITLLTICLNLYGRATFQVEGTFKKKDLINVEGWNDLLNVEGWNDFTAGFFIGSVGGAGFAYMILITKLGL